MSIPLYVNHSFYGTLYNHAQVESLFREMKRKKVIYFPSKRQQKGFGERRRSCWAKACKVKRMISR